jgi:hypothetical protein
MRAAALPGLVGGLAAALLATTAFAASAGNGGPYKAPRNGFGQPDLSGVWSNATITRLERDAKFGDRLVMTPEEAKAIEGASDKRNASLRADTDQTKKVDDLPECQSGAQGAACGYNAFWTDPGTRLIRIGEEVHTSILTEPRNGRLPLKPAAAARQRARFAGGGAGAFDGPESRGVGERCLVGFGGSSGPPLLPVLYNNHYQIQQTRDSVVIITEMVHDARVIRLGGQHQPAAVKSWMGDSIGHWEGDTLVVETTNFRPDNVFRGATAGQTVIERFSRISPQQIDYRFEVVDPDAYTAPVRGEEALNFTKDAIYEYACHEGNYAMRGILAGAREAEKSGKPVNGGDAREEGGN